MDERFQDLRGYLFAIAYRMLGSVADAEDVVQDAFLRWQKIDPATVESPKAFLSQVVTRLSIDHLRSAKVRRETYVGPWLPEPIVTDVAADPAETAEMADTLSMAFLVLLESLSPVERAVFLLREAFGYDYGEIARIVGKSEQNCRQLLARARKSVEARRPRFEPDERRRDELLERFLTAAALGDVEGLVSALTSDVVAYSDGGGVVRAGRRPIVGPDKVARFFIGLSRRIGDSLAMRMVNVNGSPGLLLTMPDGSPYAAIAFDYTEEGIREIDVVVNPSKLASIPAR